MGGKKGRGAAGEDGDALGRREITTRDDDQVGGGGVARQRRRSRCHDCGSGTGTGAFEPDSRRGEKSEGVGDSEALFFTNAVCSVSRTIFANST